MNPEKIPLNYDQRPFKLDGKVNLDITFDGKLLLSEGVCRQLL